MAAVIRFSAMALTCPRCAQAMTPHRTTTANLEGCLVCGGIFLDRDSRNRVVAAKCKETAAASDLAAAHARTSPAHHRAPCPVCRRTMLTTRVAGDVELDICDDHGAWFDRNELRRFIDALDAQRPGGARKKAVAVGAGVAVATAAVASNESGIDVEDVADAAEVGFSVLEIVGDLLGALAD